MATQFIRSLVASLALVALAFSSADAASGAVCASDMGGSLTTAHERAAADASHADCVNRDTSREETEEAPCPFGPASPGAGCATAAALPTASRLALSPSPEGTSLLPLVQTGAPLLLGSGFFRPPRA